MAKRRGVLLDTGVLAAITHPRAFSDIREWLQGLLHSGVMVFVPEIADYELRRELLRAEKQKSIIRLNSLKTNLEFLPIDTYTMLMAAEFWADARNRGYQTADDKALDADVILAAQAVVASRRFGFDLTIATTNIGHLARFCKADRWENIQ
jgi:predicted nucleic acid-binding protein